MTFSVLIVDDNLALANLYQIVFERVGCPVRRVFNGPAALESIAEEMPDVVLLDVMMPEMDGVEVCRRIRAQWPQKPPCIVIYTANNRPEMREISLQAGADVFYSKNMSVFELPSRIITHLPLLGQQEALPREAP